MEAGGGALKIELALVVLLRVISARSSDKARKTVARMAVVRVRRLAVPRPVMKLPMPWPPPMPKAAAFAALDQDDADQRQGDEDMDDEQDGEHAQPLCRARDRYGPRAF